LVAEFRELINSGEKPQSKSAQALIKKDYDQWIAPYHSFSKEEYIQFARMQIEHPKSKEHFKSVHKDFAKFYLKAVIAFAQNHLSD
jgi:hypothetical protein